MQSSWCSLKHILTRKSEFVASLGKLTATPPCFKLNESLILIIRSQSAENWIPTDLPNGYWISISFQYINHGLSREIEKFPFAFVSKKYFFS
jgi:hypothetical protein